METKSSIRKQFLSLRNAMPMNECLKKSMDITKNVLSLSVLKQAKHILCYASYKSEVMTSDLIKELLKMGKQVYLPKVSGNEMDFYHITSLEELTEGYKGIPEPSANCTDIFTKDIWEKDKERTVMLLPGAAFSENGARIGYGKGYYDRYLMRVPCEERVALCFELQMVEQIVADTHDIPVTIIVTEKSIRHIISKEEVRHFYI